MSSHRMRAQIFALFACFVCLLLASGGAMYWRLQAAKGRAADLMEQQAALRSVAAVSATLSLAPAASTVSPPQRSLELSAIIALAARLDGQVDSLRSTAGADARSAPLRDVLREASALRWTVSGLRSMSLSGAALASRSDAPRYVGGRSALSAFVQHNDADIKGSDMPCTRSTAPSGCLLSVANVEVAAAECVALPQCVAFVAVPSEGREVGMSGNINVWLKRATGVAGSTHTPGFAAGLTTYLQRAPQPGPLPLNGAGQLKAAAALAAGGGGGVDAYRAAKGRDVKGHDFDCPRSQGRGECMVECRTIAEAVALCDSMAQCVAFVCATAQLSHGRLPCWFKDADAPLARSQGTDAWVKALL